MPASRRSQADRSRSTRGALLAAARALFAERGYQHVPADEIVRSAGVTRGALYHHFEDKQELFGEVFEQLEAELTAEVRRVVADAPDHWTAAVAALSRFLEACQRPEVVRIALTDAPTVLGWQRWREVESRYGLGVIVEQLEAAGRDGALAASVPVPVLAQLVLSAVIEAALLIAHADDQAVARAEAEQALLALLSGLIKH